MTRVVLTREPPRNEELALLLRAAGLDVDEVPLTTTVDIPVTVDREWLASFRTIIVTSGRAVEVLRTFLDPAHPIVLGCVGTATARRLSEVGLAPTLVPEKEGGAAVAHLVTQGPVLTLGALETRPELGDSLRERGFTVTHLACYSTTARTLSDRHREQLIQADVVVIAAPSGWRVAQPHVSEQAIVVAMGDTTAREIAASHPRVFTGSSDSLNDVVRDLATQAR